MKKLKIIAIVIFQNPKIWIPLILIPLFQLLKVWGICSIEQAILDQTANLLSIICGGVATVMALITEFATKAEKDSRVNTKMTSAERGDGP